MELYHVLVVSQHYLRESEVVGIPIRSSTQLPCAGAVPPSGAVAISSVNLLEAVAQQGICFSCPGQACCCGCRASHRTRIPTRANFAGALPLGISRSFFCGTAMSCSQEEAGRKCILQRLRRETRRANATSELVEAPAAVSRSRSLGFHKMSFSEPRRCTPTAVNVRALPVPVLPDLAAWPLRSCRRAEETKIRMPLGPS